jgi:selenocysteine lyase/cysteine desulfurase
MSRDLRSARSLFDLPDDIIYLNAAGIGPRLTAATAAAMAAVADSAQPWRYSSADWLEAPEVLRGLAAEVLETEADGLAFIPSASYGIAVAALNLPLSKGQRVLLLAGEYPSNRNVWITRAQQTGAEVVDVRPEGGEDWTQAIMRHIDEATAVVSATPCFWTDGSAIDLYAIARRTRACGAALVIDASQSLGAMPFDFDGIGADFVISAGHKWLLGAQGLGWLWAADRWRHDGQPLEQTWVAREGRENYGVTDGALPRYRAGARRFDFGGHLAPINLAMAQAGMAQLQQWGVAAVSRRLDALNTHLGTRLRAAGLADWAQAGHVPHFRALKPPPGTVSGLAQALAAAGIIMPVRGDRLRIAPHLHIREQDLDRLVDVLLDQSKPK